MFLLADINECDEGIDECEEHCYNSIGSYFCNCTGPGYRLHSDGNTCESKSVKYCDHYTNPKICAHCYILQMSMNVLRALMTVLRSVQILMGVTSALVLLAIS